jgi:hypothetical protein
MAHNTFSMISTLVGESDNADLDAESLVLFAGLNMMVHLVFFAFIVLYARLQKQLQLRTVP